MVRPILFLVLSMVLVGVIFFRYDQSFGNDGIPSLGKRPTYAPYYPAWILPLFVVILPVILSPFYGFVGAVTVTVSTCAVLFLHISIYYLVLMALRPLLRGRISARTCAMLWVIPNLLYLTIQEVYQPTHPRWVIYLPGPWPEHLFLMWLVGCVGVLGWYILQHLRFRRRVLAPTWDPATVSAYGAHLYAPHAQPGDNIYAVTDSQALYQYLSDLTLAPLAGTYSFPTYLREFECFLSHNSDELFVAIHHQVLEVVVTGDGKVHSDFYYIPQGFDWDYLTSLLREKPPRNVSNRSRLVSDGSGFLLSASHAKDPRPR